MQSFQISYLLLLILLITTLIEAQNSRKAGCSNKYCGEVRVPYPFGIGRDCSASEWFTVDCNSSIPYLPALNNVEVLAFHEDANRFTVNMSLIKADCKNPVKHSGLVPSTSQGESPFLFSGLHNVFVVQGCGRASMMNENRHTIAGCSTDCNFTVSDHINNCFGRGCCQTRIANGNFKSFTFNLTGLESRDSDMACKSAFLVDLEYIGNISSQLVLKDDTFVPVSISSVSWNKTFNYSSGCNDVCGGISIPYPFGIGKGCSFSNWYNVDCKFSTPYLSKLNDLEILAVNVERKTVLVKAPLSSNCENPLPSGSLFLNGSPFLISKRDNMFVVEGCGTAFIMDKNSTIVSGCSTTCVNDTISDRLDNCVGVGCCQTIIPDHLDSFYLNLLGLKRRVTEDTDGACEHGSAFLVDALAYTARSRFYLYGQVPVSLWWSESTERISPECKKCNQHGGSCYPSPFVTSGMSCHFYGNSKKGVILGVSISMGLLILTMISYLLYKIIKKTKVKRRKQRCFKRNGGLLLKQQEVTNIGLVQKTILFTSSELEKATDHFNENRILGRGGQGTVYKGMLADGRIVAIKKSKVVDESQLEQFINEVVILSQVNHRNVVKLLGCCLETEVPLLVSEFISNGTLYHLIHDETGESSISLNMRLQIATEVAGAVSYLHSATSIPIYHRDIKTTNILLDEKYRSKVSDFGTSRFVSLDQTHLTTLVKGTFGYLDPEYFQSSQFTDKSDVYSFGVVLLELLTREKPISLTRFGENRSLATHFLLAMEEGHVMSIFDATVVKEGSRTELLALANLAMRCLNFNGKNRPTMKEVAIELEGIRLSHVPSTIESNFGHVKHCEEVMLTYGESTSTSMTITSQ